MTEQTSISLRNQDLLHRIRQRQGVSQSTIDPPFGDSPNMPDTYYVDSGSGSDSNDGRDPGYPKASIDSAIGSCTASQGDTILVQPGHSETLTAAIELDVIGVSIIGVGNGTLRPQITLAADDNGIEVSVANCKIQNIYFNERTVTPTSVNAYIDVSDANCQLLDLHFDVGAEDLDSITLQSGADSVEIGRCRWVTTADGPDSAIRVEAVIDLLHVHHNIFDGGTVANAFDEGHIVSGSIHTNCLVEYNTFHAIVNNFGLLFSTTATGVIQYNSFGLGTLTGMLDPGSCMCFENYEQDAIDESGLLVPGVNPAAPGVGGAHGTIDDATTDTLHGKLGKDTEFGDRSVWDILEGEGVVGGPAAAYPAINKNFADMLLWLADGTRKGSGSALGTNESLADVLYGANGIVGSWPAGTVQSGTGVPLAAGIRYTSENLRTISGAFIPGMGTQLVRAAATDLHSANGTVSAFTVGTGRILLMGLLMEVSVANVAAVACAFNFKSNPTTGTSANLCATLDIASFINGTIMSLDGVVGTALLTSTTASSVLLLPNAAHGIVIPPGTIDAVAADDASAGGSKLEITVYWIPLDTSATLVTA